MRILIVLFFSCFWYVSHAQNNEVYLKQFTQQDGLEIDKVNALAFDQNGFLWLGGGVNPARSKLIANTNPTILQRFNGNSFHTIPTPDNSNIFDIYKRKDGQFYIVTDSSLYLFDPITTKFIEIHTSTHKGTSSVFEYQDKNYVITQNNLEVIVNTIHPDLKLEEIFRFTTKVNRIKIDKKTQFIPFEDVVVISDDNFPITFVTWEGDVVKTIDPKGFENERELALRKKWIDGHFQMNGQHYVLLYNYHQVYRIDPDVMELIPVMATENQILSTILKTYNDPKGGHSIISSYKDQLSIQTLHKTKGLTTVYEDKKFGAASSFEIVSKDIQRDAWFTTNNTLHYIKFPSDIVTTLLPDKEIRAITPLSEKKHLIATEKDGWQLFNSSNNTIKPYTTLEQGDVLKPSSSRNFFIEGSTIWSNDTAGGIIEVDTLTREIQYYRHYPVICMVRPTDSTIVYGTKGYNLMEFNTHKKTHTPLVATDSLEIYDLEWRKADNHIVASTSKGVLTYDLSSKEHALYNDPAQLPDPFLLMGEYHPEYGYIQGSRSGIITTFDLATKEFKTLYQDELQAGIATILFDDQDNWWINTFNGIVSFNPASKQTHRFSVKNGFTNNEANRYSALKTEDGFLVGTIQGLNFFDPEKLQPEVNTAQIVPLRISTYNTQDKKYSVSHNQFAFAKSSLRDSRLSRERSGKAKTITLPSENRALEIGFALTQPDVTRNERYRYRLDDKEWVSIGNTQSIRFPNLAAGRYMLEVEALDFSGKKIGDSLLLPIHSKDFFYKTWWFFLIITVIISSILFWMLRQQQLRKRLQEGFSQDLMQSQEEERARIAKDLHDSVGQQLTLIKQKLQEQGKTTISELTHKALEEIRHISRGLYPTIIKQLGLSGSIEQLLYDVDEQTDLFVSADIDDIDDLFDENEALHIYRFVQENVSNIIKHAFAKAFSVTIQKEKNTIQITIKDNGKGFEVSEKQKNHSLGLKTMEERIRILAGIVTIESSLTSGTVTTAQIPHSYAKK
ncbi:ATP-binding protein [uncultured Dokdonia sp.]|uniref:sensor histidine kinase n=1 Tax=uncultured Dokdonia sp. TaxID=575653 RepID=UPI002627DBD3|nr:ATP-binding protein [uncultured Dokdonia sp.]